MAHRLDTTTDRPFRTAKAFTAHVRVGSGGRAGPISPGPPEEKWVQLETERDITGESVDMTRWARVCRDFWGTTRLAGAGKVVARMLQIHKAPDKPEG
jgi:hypothetical protein